MRGTLAYAGGLTVKILAVIAVTWALVWLVLGTGRIPNALAVVPAVAGVFGFAYAVVSEVQVMLDRHHQH